MHPFANHQISLVSRHSAVEPMMQMMKNDSQPASIESDKKRSPSNDYYKSRLLHFADVQEESDYSEGDGEGGMPASEKEAEENYFKMYRKLSKAPSEAARSIKTEPSTTMTARSHIDKPIMVMSS